MLDLSAWPVAVCCCPIGPGACPDRGFAPQSTVTVLTAQAGSAADTVPKRSGEGSRDHAAGGPGKTSDDQVVLGVDTHKDVHVAVVLSVLGVLLAAREFPTTKTGYRDMLTWVRSYGPLHRAGVEGTGSYGAALTRLLRTEGCAGRRGQPAGPGGAAKTRQE